MDAEASSIPYVHCYSLSIIFPFFIFQLSLSPFCHSFEMPRNSGEHGLERRTKVSNEIFYVSIWSMVFSMKCVLAERWMENGIIRSTGCFVTALTVVETTQCRWQSRPKCVYTRNRLSAMTIQIDHFIWCGCAVPYHTQPAYICGIIITHSSGIMCINEHRIWMESGADGERGVVTTNTPKPTKYIRVLLFSKSTHFMCALWLNSRTSWITSHKNISKIWQTMEMMKKYEHWSKVLIIYRCGNHNRFIHLFALSMLI